MAQTPTPTDVFKEGMNMIFTKWTALQLAIENSPYAYNHLDHPQIQLEELTLEYFQQVKNIDASDLSFNLEEFVSDQLHATFEDGSANLVSLDLLKLWNDVMNNDFKFAEQIKTEFKLQSKGASVLQLDYSSDSDSESEVVSTRITKAEKPEKVIDEDGFELVTRRKRN